MTESHYDAIVLGVGGMGSAALYHLAGSGCRVLGLEQFGVPHRMGSSHGSTRIFRMAYSEGNAYVPLLRSALECWRGLERATGKSILELRGGLDIGPEGSWVVEGSRKSCLEHSLRFEELDGSDVGRRFPGYRLPPGMGAIFQPDGGYMHCEVAVSAHAEAAVALGAQLRTGERVRDWSREGAGLRVRTDAGCYRAPRLVIAAGPWTGQVVPELQPSCRPQRQVLLWTDPRVPALFAPQVFPVFNMLTNSGRFYGIPAQGGDGFKIGKYYHLEQEVDDPYEVERTCDPADEAVLRGAIEAYFPEADGPTRAMTTCLFTNSPDRRFILDRHPDEPGVFVAAGFSGHGFKFCSVVGKLMAQLCLDETPDWDIDEFRMDRFGAGNGKRG